jgi:two-component system chemotaxis response regulator CheY
MRFEDEAIALPDEAARVSWLMCARVADHAARHALKSRASPPMGERMSSAVLIEDSPLTRRRMRAILAEVDCEVVGEAPTGEELPLLYERLRPLLVIMDVVLPGRDGLTIASELIQRNPEALVIICSSLSSREKVLASQKAGVAYYLLKPFEPERIKSVVKFVLATRGKRPTVHAG